MPSEMMGSGDPLSESAIARAEKRLGRAIPAPYRDFLLRHNGGYPEAGEFDAPGPRPGSTMPVSLGSFLGIDMPEETYNLDYVLETFGDRIPEGSFPIARDAGGGLVLLGSDHRVLYWDPDREIASPLADGLDAFLRTLG